MKKLLISVMLAALLTISTVAVASAGDGRVHAVQDPSAACDAANLFLNDLPFLDQPGDFIPCPEFVGSP